MVSRLAINPRSRELWKYWIHDEDKRWMTKPHPWTALRNALIKEGVPPEQADGLATNIMQATPQGRRLFAAHHGKGKTAGEKLANIHSAKRRARS